MRDEVNIAMYLVYLSWTVCRKIVTNKQGQIQAPILYRCVTLLRTYAAL